MFSALIVDGLEGEWQLPSYSNQMVSGLVHCRDAAADWSGAGWNHNTYIAAVVTARSNHSCWDKITVKNRRGGGVLDARGGVPEPLEPSPGFAPVTRVIGLSLFHSFFFF